MGPSSARKHSTAQTPIAASSSPGLCPPAVMIVVVRFRIPECIRTAAFSPARKCRVFPANLISDLMAEGVLRSPALMTGKKRVNDALQSAIGAAHAAGEIMRRNLRAPKKINESTQHDIKLELDVRCQQTIERELRKKF